MLLPLAARSEALRWGALSRAVVFAMMLGASLGLSRVALAAGAADGSVPDGSTSSRPDDAPSVDPSIAARAHGDDRTAVDEPAEEHVESDFLRVDPGDSTPGDAAHSQEPGSLFAELPDAALRSDQASVGGKPDSSFRATCQNWGVSEWNDTTPTYDPDGDLAFYSDARGAIMIAPLRVRAIADDTIDRAPKPCGADAFAQALDNDRHSPEKAPPPVHVDPADLSRALDVPLSSLLEEVDAPPPAPLRSDEARRGIDRPPTVG